MTISVIIGKASLFFFILMFGKCCSRIVFDGGLNLWTLIRMLTEVNRSFLGRLADLGARKLQKIFL
jgi:hypothetical protein